jgi:hypothetical protein
VTVEVLLEVELVVVGTQGRVVCNFLVPPVQLDEEAAVFLSAVQVFLFVEELHSDQVVHS